MDRIVIKPKSITNALGIIVCTLVIISTADQIIVYFSDQTHGEVWQKVLFLGRENNVPTFFSVLLLFVITLLQALITCLKIPSRSYVYHWAALTCGFLLMTFDEAWSFHERLIRPMRSLLGGNHFGFFYYAWVIPAIILVLILGLFFFKFLLHLTKETRILFLLAATLFLGGAIGVELVEGRYDEIYGHNNLTYAMFVTVEESLEMAGLVFYIYGLLIYLSENYQNVVLSFDASDEK